MTWAIAGGTRRSARAPGKCILFGEHSVVHGGPELLLALDLDVEVSLSRSAEGITLNGNPTTASENPYLQSALVRWPTRERIAVRTTSQVPRSAGLGSSAAFCSGLATLLRPSPTEGPASVAQAAFEIERGAQGVGSPGDTSASVAGGLITVNSEVGESLWTVADGDRRWTVRQLAAPPLPVVVAYSGVPRSTADAVRAVGRRLAQPDGPALLESFADVTREGIDAVRGGDAARVGRAMKRNQQLLRDVGVSHPRLEELLTAVEPHAEGAKLTGAGLGGSVVVVPRPGELETVVKRLARAGAVAWAIGSPGRGAAVRPDP